MTQLKPDEQKAILAGHYPEIIRPHEGACPFEVGEEIVLQEQRTRFGPIPHVSIEITGFGRRKNGAWEARYRVRDGRGVYAAMGIGYTRSPSRALDPEAPILDPDVIEAYAAEGVQKTTLLSAEQRQREKASKAESKAGRGKLAEEYAARERKRLEAA